MKKNLLLFLCISLLCNTHAQFSKPSSSNSFSDSLNKVVLAYKINFSSIEGKAMPDQDDAAAYHSKIGLPGALHCFILRYRSVKDKSASWQAVMYEGESYAEALKIYKQVFRELSSTKLTGIEKGIVSMKGDMEKPDENVRFTVSSLRLNTNDAKYKNLAADIELSNNYDGWEVHLNLYTKKQEIEMPEN